eukprot:TRINITY_DN335_c0_g1_i1.p1 TRINITY_DN335_c0_g1~~TRINITY_DN335_c0_g1_i1.p1  ORF type:complete len:648 (+),score=280.10 TRINITY_DN335_c0_g1_i1:73-1944(+)
MPAAKRSRTAGGSAVTKSSSMRTVRGVLMFEEPRTKPLHHIAVELSLVGEDAKWSTETDMNGAFCISYDPKGRSPDLQLRVTQTEVRYKGDVLVPVSVDLANADIEVARDVTDDDYDFGTLYLPYWQRADRTKGFTPRTLVDDQHEIPQKQRTGHTVQAVAVGVYSALDFNPFNSIISIRTPTENKTIRMRENRRSIKPESDDYHVEMALNGFNPRLLRQKKGTNLYYMDFSYESLGLDGMHFAPDTTAYFALNTNTGKLKLTEIELRRRCGDFQSSPYSEYAPTPEKYSPNMPGADGREKWERAKHIWRCNYFFFGEVATHLTETHLNMEQYILAVQRNVRKNPVLQLLAPHMYGTVLINKLADKILTAPTGLVVKHSAVTPVAVAEAVHAHAGTMNWHDWKPRESVSKSHRFAYQQALYWDVVTEYVNFFFEEHAADIEAQWQEIKLMSDELVANAVPFVDTSCEPWQDLNEVNKRSSPHPAVEGTRVALSPVTADEAITDDNRAQNLANLKQMCAYFILHATFRHTYVNDAQYDMGGDPQFATLGLLKDPLVDPTGAVSEEAVRDHRRVTYALVNVKYGYLMKDEDSNIHPKLKELLERERRTFLQVGLDVDTIRSCVNL